MAELRRVGPWYQTVSRKYANYFWWPADVQLKALGTMLLKRAPRPAELAELRALVFGPGGALRAL